MASLPSRRFVEPAGANGNSINEFTNNSNDSKEPREPTDELMSEHKRAGEQKFDQDIEIIPGMESALEEQDAILDQILEGVISLENISKATNKALKHQQGIIDEVDIKIDGTIDAIANENERLRRITHESSDGSCCKWIMVLFCFVILLSLVGVLTNKVNI